jgi:hypothetical protein
VYPTSLSTGGPSWNTGYSVGFGVTPSSWGSPFIALEGGDSDSQSFVSFQTNDNSAIIGANTYYNGGWKYKNAGAASYMQTYNGQFLWNSAASGSAGAAASFTQVLGVTKDYSLALQGATSKTGTGITFPATQSASSNANTLDDYEEGTWAPTDGSGAGLSLTVYQAKYTKIGNQVTVNCYIAYPSNSNGSQAIVNGLPFASIDNQYPTGVISTNAGVTSAFVRINGATTAATLYTASSGTGTVTNSTLSGYYIIFTITYFVS